MKTFSEWLIIEQNHKYSNVQIRLPADISRKVLSWGKKHITAPLEREDDIHITILYGLHDKTPERTFDFLRKYKPRLKPIDVTLGKISKFENDTDVIKIDVESKELRRIHEILKELPHETTHPEYKPHCTIAYVTKGSCDSLLGNQEFDGLKFTTNKLTFSGNKKTSMVIA